MTDGLCLARKTLGIYSDCKSTCSNWLKKIRNWGWIQFRKKRWFFRTEEWAIKLAMTMHTLDAAHVTTHCAASRQRRKVSIENHIQTWNETSRQASVDELNYLNKSWPSRPRRDVFFHHWKTSLPTIFPQYLAHHFSAEILVYIPSCCISKFSTSTNIDSFFPDVFCTSNNDIACCEVLFPRPRQVFVWSSVALRCQWELWLREMGQKKKHGRHLVILIHQTNTIHLFKFIFLYLYIDISYI